MQAKITKQDSSARAEQPKHDHTDKQSKSNEVFDSRKIEAKDIVPSLLLNRIESNYQTASFQALKKDILHAGGNVQPIKVRPTAGGKYEIVFGHRRHRACADLNLPVLAIVENLTDVQLWEQMERENRLRKNLSPFEQGMHYKLALDKTLFESIRRMAEAIGGDPGNIAKMLGLANLPQQVIEAFEKTSDIQVNWATPLKWALERDRDGMITRAENIATSRKTGNASVEKMSPKSVLAALVGSDYKNAANDSQLEIFSSNGQKRAVIKPGKGGTWRIDLSGPGLNLHVLEDKIKKILESS
ncbi:ParB/RepB/Spo0J family partition protein [Pseudaquabacterium pictum]|uniref:ParB-like N-terminal domain-containing protein n=1 Tax=Pseudaquabacterium pictum TaxID=2315236 RepID=A0A480AY13_9BURK|nr:ParB/RepB/Spo0J family partition protein [Rubrivivax pictus]GCL65132.1 hypothetical protein AQPW35_42130 [Rubrivivax pictus]